MLLATSCMIPQIDRFAEEVLQIPTEVLMERSGVAVADAVRSLCTEGSRVVVLAGSGNNGGDGYAAAFHILPEYKVRVFDIFAKGQKGKSGKIWRDRYLCGGGKIVSGLPSEEELSSADCVVDAIFGTGFKGAVPTEILPLVEQINSLDLPVVSVDLPLGINADDGSVGEVVLDSDITVSLSYSKVGVHSYPAAEHIKKVVVNTIGLDCDAVKSKFAFSDFLIDEALARSLLPKRKQNSSKGSFGRASLIVGGEKYLGAAMLALEAALRGGAGYVQFIGEESLCDKIRYRYPEAIYIPLDYTTDGGADSIADYTKTSSAILVGSGCGCTESLYFLVSELLSREGAPIVLDADAINAIATYGSSAVIAASKRKVILTPHPLELSRLTGLPVPQIQANRYAVAREFAEKHGCILVLKGAATIVTDGSLTYINSSGSSALAKAGSGDVLAGLITSLLSFTDDELEAASLAVYLHGVAGDNMAEQFSEFGVTPSDLPKECARIISSLTK